MVEESQLKQGEINRIWKSEWEKEAYTARSLFKHRLGIEGYPIFKKYIPKEAKTILDVGGGTGRNGIKFAQDFPSAKIYITDILEESFSVVRGIAEEVGVTNFETKKEDVNSLSFPDNFFDVVFCDVVIQHLPDVSNAMKEMRRVLKPNGILIVAVNNVWNPHTLYKKLMGASYRYGYERSYTRKELRELFGAHGLEVIAEDGFYPAYGISRLKEHWKPFATIGSILNRLNKIIDPWTRRVASRYLGFEIFCVGRKPLE